MCDCGQVTIHWIFFNMHLLLQQLQLSFVKKIMSKRNLGNTEEMHTFLAPNKMICNFNGQGYDDNPIKGIQS